MLIKPVAKNTLYLILGRVLSKIITLGFTIYLARKLGDFGFGKYSFALTIASFIGLFGSLGSEFWLTRELAQNKEKSQFYLGNVLSLQIFVMIMTSLLLIIILGLTQLKFDFGLILLMSIALIFRYYSLPVRAIFAANQRFEFETIAMMCDAGLAALGGIFAIQLGFGLVGLALSQAFAAIFLVLISLLLVNKKFIKPTLQANFTFWLDILRKNVPFLLLGIFSFFYLRIDIVMLKFMQGENVVGWYSAAYRIIDSLLLLAMNYGQALLPAFSESYHNNKQEMIKHFRLSLNRLFILGIGICCFVTIFSRPLISLLYGKAYTNSIIVLKIVIWKVLPGFVNYVLGNTLIAIGKEKIPSLTIGTGSAINVIANFILIPQFGYIGAAIAAVITETYAFLLQFFLVMKYLHLRISFLLPKKVWSN